jgi:monoamine oxidase
MDRSEILIIGAGISGLVAARELSKAGKKVTILEAKKQSGGRIHTLSAEEFPYRAETGAEFVHGKLPETLKLLKEYKIDFTPVEGEVWQMKNGIAEKEEDMIRDYRKELRAKLSSIEEDMTVEHFLDTYFSGPQYELLRHDVARLVEGYDGADLSRASIFTLNEEWPDVEKQKQFRVKGGLSLLIKALEEECRERQCVFEFSCVVKNIRWQSGSVTAECEDGKTFSASAVVVTVPLGVLQEGSLNFFPALPDKTFAAQQLGFGEVIKILICFREAFWKTPEIKQKIGKDLSRMSFLFSDAIVPTWWTQYPDDSPLLTGWLSGSAARKRRFYSGEDIYKEAVSSLAYIFNIPEQRIWLMIRCRKIVHWTQDVFARGAYSYATVNAKEHIAILGRPVEKTLFFAGELFAPESGVGVAEAAIVSGQETAKQIILRTSSTS